MKRIETARMLIHLFLLHRDPTPGNLTDLAGEIIAALDRYDAENGIVRLRAIAAGGGECT